MIITINCDGGSRGNPGPAACAFVAWDSAGKMKEKRGKYLGIGTNNEAEYGAVIEAWKYLNEVGSSVIKTKEGVEVNFFLDSNLVVNQINGNFKVKEQRLQKLLFAVRNGEGSSQFKATYSYIPREKNAEADKLVNQTLDLEKFKSS